MLDKKSEKVLKFLISKYDNFNAKGHPVYLPNTDLDIEYEEIKQICDHLYTSGLLLEYQHTATVKQIKVFISREGLVYFEKQKLTEQLRRKNFRHEWYVALFSALTGSLAGLLTTIIYNILKQSQQPPL